MSKRLLAAFFISLFAVATLIAASVKGKLLDSQGEPLIGATVTLLALPDSTVITGVMTGEDGLYEFKSLTPRRYLLRYSMTGMDTDTADFEVTDTTTTVSIPPIKLYDSSTVLSELLVKGVKTAVVAKQDTIEFNADSFHTTDNAVVEDLLKKLPGVEVASDGSITSGGKTVSKILVNGKEFFEDDPKMASKNLSAKMVNKVQVVDRKSDQARLTGVDDGEEETVINLTIKKGMEESWFGNVRAGYGTDGRYTGNFIINRMVENNMFTLIGSANNTNNAGFTDRGRGNFNQFGGSGGINATQMLGTNFNVGNGEKFRIGGNISYNHSDRDARTSSETIFNLPDSNSYQSSSSKVRDKAHNFNAGFRMRWNIDDNNTLDFQPQFSYSTRKSTSASVTSEFAGDASRSQVNKKNTDQTNHGDSWSASGNLTYVHKFEQKKGRSLSVRGDYSFSDTKQHGTSLSDIIYYTLSEDGDDFEKLFRYTDNHTWNNSIGGRVTWTEPIGREGNYLEFAYNVNVRNSDADKLVYNIPLPDAGTYDEVLPDFNAVPEGAMESDSLSNRFRNNFLTQSIRLGWKRTTKEYNINAGIELRPSSSQSEDLIMSARNIPRRNVWNFAPFFRMRYKFTNTMSLNINYRSNSSQPSMSQLQPVPDVSDPLHIKIGNPDLKPSFTQRLMARFNDFDTESQRSIMAMLMGSYIINNVVGKTVTDRTTGARTTTYTNESGDFNVNFMGMYNQPFRNRNWRVFANLDGRYSVQNGYTNGEFNRSNDLNLRPRAGLTFSTEVVQISANPQYSWQYITNSLAGQKNRTNSSYGFNADFTLTLPFGLQFGTDLDYSKTTGLSAGYDSSTWLWNANMQYTIPKTQGLSIFVEAHDLLGDAKNISRSMGQGQIVDTRYNNLTRYFMFGLSWQFNSLNFKKMVDKMAENGDIPMPPPGEGGSGMRPLGPPPGGMGGPGGGHRPF